MSKILTVLAPIAAIMAFAVVPAMAQAENDQIQGTEYTVASVNLTTQFGEREFGCTSSSIQLQTTANDEQALVIGGAFRGPGGSFHCPTGNPGETAVIQTNAGIAGWFFHTGQEGDGSLQGALANIQFEAHLFSSTGQAFLETCHFEAQEGLHVEYEPDVQNPNLSVRGNLDYECENDGPGEAQLESDFFTDQGDLKIDSPDELH